MFLAKFYKLTKVFFKHIKNDEVKRETTVVMQFN